MHFVHHFVQPLPQACHGICLGFLQLAFNLLTNPVHFFGGKVYSKIFPAWHRVDLGGKCKP